MNHKLGKLEGSVIPHLDWTPKTMATYGGLLCSALGGRGGGTSCGGSWHSSKGMGSSSENCFGGRGGGGDSPPSALRGRDLISTVTGRMPGEVKVIDTMYHTSLILRPSASLVPRPSSGDETNPQQD